MGFIIRQDVSTKDWTIFSEERASRPHYNRDKAHRKKLKRYEPDCPFCRGNEDQTPKEVFSIKDGNDWSVRVVKNKYPAVRHSGDKSIISHGHRYIEGPHFSIDGVGEHEVIIESPWHNDNLAKMELSRVEKVLRAYRRRFIDISSEPENQLVVIFKNHGCRAGTSLEHPHSQLVATPFVPVYIRNKMYESQRYYDDYGRCVFCDIIDYEMKSKERLVHVNDKYIAIAPYASIVPYNIIIYPKKHESCFAEIDEVDLVDLSSVLQLVLKKLYDLLGDPDYNFVIDSSPIDQSGNRHYHWHIKILPGLSTRAGFEIGSGININTILPETCAKNLRDGKVVKRSYF
jgi:UDPglucose--hexose-1-phosphate uridylyltransferase